MDRVLRQQCSKRFWISTARDFAAVPYSSLRKVRRSFPAPAPVFVAPPPVVTALPAASHHDLSLWGTATTKQQQQQQPMADDTMILEQLLPLHRYHRHHCLAPKQSVDCDGSTPEDCLDFFSLHNSIPQTGRTRIHGMHLRVCPRNADIGMEMDPPSSTTAPPGHTAVQARSISLQRA